MERVLRLVVSWRAFASRMRARGEAMTAEALLRASKKEEKATMVSIEVKVVEMLDDLLCSGQRVPLYVH